MIERYFSIKENDYQTYDFQFIRITEDCNKDDTLINELQKSIIREYREPSYLQRKRRNLDRAGLEDYIRKKVIPDEITNFDLATRYGDFGEIFASLVIQFVDNKKTFNKLQWKFNKDKSVFGTDIVSFDSLEEPSEICYYEVKTRENCLNKEEVSRKKIGDDEIIEKEYISVIAYKSLEKDMLSDKESILDYMSRFYHATGDEDISDLFSDLVDGVKSVNKSYEVFIITDSKNLSKDYKSLLTALNSYPKTINPLKVTFIFIDSIKQLMTETWNTIVEHGAVFIEENSL